MYTIEVVHDTLPPFTRATFHSECSHYASAHEVVGPLSQPHPKATSGTIRVTVTAPNGVVGRHVRRVGGGDE